MIIFAFILLPPGLPGIDIPYRFSIFLFPRCLAKPTMLPYWWLLTIQRSVARTYMLLCHTRTFILICVYASYVRTTINSQKCCVLHCCRSLATLEGVTFYHLRCSYSFLPYIRLTIMKKTRKERQKRIRKSKMQIRILRAIRETWLIIRVNSHQNPRLRRLIYSRWYNQLINR